MLKELRITSAYRDTGDGLRTALLHPLLNKTVRLLCWLPVLSLQDVLRSTYGILGLIAGRGSAQFLVRVEPNYEVEKDKRGSRDFMHLLTAQFNQLLLEARSSHDLTRLGLLAWLLVNDRLTISFAVTVQDGRSAACAGLPPTLCGIATDDCDNCVTYILADAENVGSGELTAECAWSWGDPGRRVAARLKTFDQLLSTKVPGIMIVPLPDDLRQKLLVFLPSVLPAEEPPIGVDDAGRRPSLYLHQEQALQGWSANGYRGIFKMCTGAGKTIAALEGVRRLDASLRVDGKCGLSTVVVVCPTQVLVEQWDSEVRDYGFSPPLLAYGSFASYANQLVPVLNQQERTANNLRLVVTTYATFADQSFAGALNAARGFGRVSGLLIGDEMHRASALRVRSRLKEYTPLFQYRLGLSATPESETDAAAERMLFEYFGGIQATYELKDAIRDEVLCRYSYFPIPAYLDAKTSQRYFRILQGLDEAERHGNIDISLYRERNDLIRNSDLAVNCFDALMDGKVRAGESIGNTLVYCPPGRTDYEEDAEMSGTTVSPDIGQRRIEQIGEILNRLSISKTAILGGDARQLRKESVEAFASGKCQVLLGIGCLDEGLDIPNIREAIILYSCDRARQFVQRRGRILRKAHGKDMALIRDIILLPQNAEMPPSVAERLLRREMRRYAEFASLAENKSHAERILNDALTAATIKR